jgi:hypothetical protein
MNRALNDKEAELAILQRMAISRAALLAANSTPPSVRAVHGQTWSPAANLIALLADAPRVTLMLALCVGAIVLGPRRTIVIVITSTTTQSTGDVEITAPVELRLADRQPDPVSRLAQ